MVRYVLGLPPMFISIIPEEPRLLAPVVLGYHWVFFLLFVYLFHPTQAPGYIIRTLQLLAAEMEKRRWFGVDEKINLWFTGRSGEWKKS